MSYFAILTLVAPISLAAQQPPAALPANPVTAAFRTRISASHRNIAQAFDSIPESKFSYKPTPAQLSIGFIAQHVASDDYFFCNNFGALKGTRPAEDTTTADSVKATWPKAKLMARLKDSFAFCDQAIAQLDDAKLGEAVTITFGGNSRTVARAGYGTWARAGPGRSLQPARELHASEQHPSADCAAKTASGGNLAVRTRTMLLRTRRPSRTLLLLQVAVGVGFLHSDGASAQAPIVSAEAARRARSLLKAMTLEEKIGQLNLTAGIGMGGFASGASDDDLTHGRIGAILWLADTKEINRMQHLAVEKSRLHIPLLFGLDVIHGYRTIFPAPLGMASSWDPDVEEQAQALAATETRSAGIRWTFTPMVDIARDARWGRIQEGAGEDPYLGAAMARAQVRGFQGAALGPNSVVACVKHFAGYGAAEGGRDYDASYVPEELMENVYLVPFHAAVKQGVGSVMSAYMDLNDVPASGNPWLLTDVLRKDWDFRGFVASDAFAIASLQTHGYASDPSDAAYKAVTAGAGMDMASPTYKTTLAKLVSSGRVSQAKIDAAVLPILEIKYQIGLFDHPYVDESAVAMDASATGRSLARRLGARSMVLLRNEHHALPLSKTIRNVAVIGKLADSPADITGGPTPAGIFTRTADPLAVTVLAALRNRLGAGSHIMYVPGPEASKAFPGMFDAFMGHAPVKPPTPAEIADWLAKSKAAAESADVIIAVVGEPALMSGENASRGTLDLPGIQEQMVEAAASSGKPLVVVLVNGRPLEINWIAEHASAILESWLPGVEGGNAIADVIFGNVNPGGKLPVSWPRSAGQEPLYYNHNLTQAPESDPKFTSRYWDISSKPLYPFGYGLSYTTFAFANLRLSKASMRAGDSAEVVVDVRNTGAVPGDVVAQLYIHQRSGSASRPVRQLEGFRRVPLQPGETRTLSFRLGRDELQFWSPRTKAWAVEPSVYDVWVGEDSAAPLHGELTIGG